MNKCHWIVESGDHILYCDGDKKVTIPRGDDIKADEGRPGASTVTLEELKSDLEKEFCGSTIDE